MSTIIILMIFTPIKIVDFINYRLLFTRYYESTNKQLCNVI